jgi:hypothetical protein
VAEVEVDMTETLCRGDLRVRPCSEQKPVKAEIKVDDRDVIDDALTFHIPHRNRVGRHQLPKANSQRLLTPPPPARRIPAR